MPNSHLHYERAQLLFTQGRIADAKKELSQSLQQDPENAYALGLLAQCEFADNNIQEGIRLAQSALAIEPEESHFHYLLAHGDYHLDKHSSAMTHLDKAIELNPYDAEYFGFYAFLLVHVKRFEQALHQANIGLEIDPENLTCLNARSRALTKLGRVEEAEESMQNTLHTDPDNAISHSTIGWNFLEKGKHKEARSHFLESLRLDPDSDSGRVGLKESLKSAIPPYRWFLQFSFWLENRTKNFRLIFFIGLYVAVRFIYRATENNPGMELIGLLVLGLYLVLVFSSWILNPLANIFLLLHPIGKHALSKEERVNAFGFLTCVLLGITIITLHYTVPAMSEKDKLYAGVLALTLAIPIGHIQWPVRLSLKPIAPLLNLLVIAAGLTSFLLALGGYEHYLAACMVYLALFVIYSWATNF